MYCTNPLLQILCLLQHYKMKLFNMDESCRFEWIGLYFFGGGVELMNLSYDISHKKQS